uniref:Uncharacterized protein n=1 Tax=Oryza glumipatula TaxID=40148 RepID=A0A0E0A5H2_9ORYZ
MGLDHTLKGIQNSEKMPASSGVLSEAIGVEILMGSARRRNGMSAAYASRLSSAIRDQAAARRGGDRPRPRPFCLAGNEKERSKTWKPTRRKRGPWRRDEKPRRVLRRTTSAVEGDVREVCRYKEGRGANV